MVTEGQEKQEGYRDPSRTVFLCPDFWSNLLRGQVALFSVQEVEKAAPNTLSLWAAGVGTGPRRGGAPARNLSCTGLPLYEKSHGVTLSSPGENHQSEDLPARRWQ